MVDLPALRAARQRTGMANILSRQPYEAYAPAYDAADAARPNAMADGEMDEAEVVIARQRSVIQRLADD